MAVGKGATSLVELILKKFGDDTAAGTAGLTGLLAAGQSEDSEAGPLSKAAKIAALRAEANAARFGPSEPDSILDFVRAKAYRQGDDIPDTSYRGGHTAPVDPEYNAPLHDLTGTYPEDVYSANGPSYYGQGDELDEKSFEVINEVRGNPDAPVAMYRAVPSDAPDEILPGDWVTTNPDYAVQHAEMHMEPSEWMDPQQWKILEAETNAGRLRTDGNSPHEYGYTGNATVPLLGATAAGTAGLLAAPALMKDEGSPSSASEAGFPDWGRYEIGPSHGLPTPTWGDIGSSVAHVLGAPMTGLQGLARGGYGLLTGEDFTEAAAQAGNTMDVGWRDGILDTSNMNPDKGADQAASYVTDKTGDESLGWMVKMGLLFGGI